MPWQERNRMSLRLEFVRFAQQEGANVAALCRQFGIARKTGYKWLGRYAAAGPAGLADRSRRPRRAPARTGPAVEQRVLDLRARHPAWGGRKLRRRLQDLGHAAVPAASTITAILHRHGLIDPADAQQRQPWRRFERPRPNDLWQMDFKGDFAVATGQRCYPLTVLDDHSRFALGVRACANYQTRTVRAELTGLFQRYGLPRAMLMDNGSPWGGGPRTARCLGYSRLTVWLLRLDIGALHGRPYHPQTQGKDERFNRTLQTELLRDQVFADHAAAQRAFDPWRDVYNTERPHEALDLATPVQRYQPSPRAFPEALPPLEYLGTDHVRTIAPAGQLRFRGRAWWFSEAFAGQRVGLRATAEDGVWAIYFGRFHVADLDERGPGVRRPRGAPPVAALPAAPPGAPPSETRADDTHG